MGLIISLKSKQWEARHHAAFKALVMKGVLVHLPHVPGNDGWPRFLVQKATCLIYFDCAKDFLLVISEGKLRCKFSLRIKLPNSLFTAKNIAFSKFPQGENISVII